MKQVAKVLVCLLVIIISYHSVFAKHNNTSIKHTTPNYRTLLVEEVEEYIHTAAPKSKLSAEKLVTGSIKYDVDPALVLAMGHQESHFGTAGVASRTKSVWNVGGVKKGSKTKYTRHYSHVNDSIDQFLELLSDRYLYKKTTSQLLKHFVNREGKRYAADLQYESKIKSKYIYIKTKTRVYDLWLKVRNKSQPTS